MPARDHDEDRKVIPRWLSLAASSKQGEIGPLRSSTASSPFTDDEREASLAEHLEDWAANRTLPFAGDFISAALVLGATEDAREAAQHVLDSPGASPLAAAIARRVLDPESASPDRDEFDPFDVMDIRSRVARLKGLLRDDPRTGLSWAEIARSYAALGQGDKALAAMEVALALVPEDRFLLRSASRLHIHLGEPDRAHRLLSSSARLRNDPWLLSAEIAVAPLAGRTSRHQGHAKRLLESGRFVPHSTSELASALGTEALNAGDSRNARRLIAESSRQPTENAVAQAEWASRRERTIEFDKDLLGTDDSFEARAHFYATQHQEKEAIVNAAEWLREQPFAEPPAIFGSYRAALIRDYETSIAFCQVGLQANPTDYMIRNNLIFALASSGEITRAREQLALLEDHIRGRALEEDWKLILAATQGLVAFREGNVAEGRAAYLDVIRNAHDPTLRAQATILLAREEAVAGTQEAPQAIRAARELVGRRAASDEERQDDTPHWLDHLPSA